MVDVFSHPWLSGLFKDAETAEIWSAESQLASMLVLEATWSRFGHVAKLWNKTDGLEAAETIIKLKIAPEQLLTGTSSDGVCVPALVELIKKAAGDAVHTGLTSQDLLDTAVVIAARDTLKLLSGNLGQLESTLATLENKFASTQITGRTRMQAALPIAFSTRSNAWRLPLLRHKQRINEIKPRLCVVQIGGAVGEFRTTNAYASSLIDKVAQELKLLSSETSWHNQRDNIVEFANLLSLITGTLGKMGQDICLMAQQGIDEIIMTSGGASSAMPHKQNPVLAELLVTLARFNATQVAAMHHALVHEQERSGTAWALEWMTLPQMAEATVRALKAAIELISLVERIGSE